MAKDTTKIIQALAYLADHQPEKVSDNMKAFKLLWLADRYHLRQTGRTITGDAYYAMPFGIVPSDAKCLLEGEKTKLKNRKGYQDRYIRSVGNHQYAVLSQPDLKVFSESDQEALDKVLAVYGSYGAMKLSELSHKFPEWTFYRELLEDKDSKKSYKIDLDHFFENSPEEGKQLFDDSPELLLLTKELYHQYNHD
jgi:uncharacterized phage-associated protein